MRKREKRVRRKLWIGSFESWNPMKWYSFVSSRRHDKPFNKRDRARRSERKLKQRQREQLLCQSI